MRSLRGLGSGLLGLLRGGELPLLLLLLLEVVFSEGAGAAVAAVDVSLTATVASSSPNTVCKSEKVGGVVNGCSLM